MAKTSLIVIGIIFLVVTVIATQVVITPAQKSDIRTTNSLCTAEINAWGINVPIGNLGQKILGKEEDCKNIHYMMLLIDYGWVGYAIGGLFFILGIALGNEHAKKKIGRDKKGSFCGDCGSKLEGHEKHCSECGSKVR